MRCSVVCKNPKHLTMLINQFTKVVGSRNYSKASSTGVCGIVRTKNGFSNLNSNEMKLEDYNYSDIKINVFCKSPNGLLILDFHFIHL